MVQADRPRVDSFPKLPGATRYDRVASLLISTLLLSGTSVAVLGVLWLGAPQAAIFKCQFDFVSSGGEQSGTETTELEMPPLSELPQLAIAEPTFEISKLLSRDAVAAASELEIDGSTRAEQLPGLPGPPDEVPRWERWEIRYEVSSLKSYARQLDFFGIELGAVGKIPLVDYASHFTDATPATRSDAGSNEERLYFSWRSGRLKAMDRKLLDRAGVDVTGRTLLQFYSKEVEALLAQIEAEHAEGGRVDKLRKTIFGVRRARDGFEFYIIEQF
jgi:hypothetical protein